MSPTFATVWLPAHPDPDADPFLSKRVLSPAGCSELTST
jgi:hypothetical protein